eukprot:1519561-Rhodomonas_salina.2
MAAGGKKGALAKLRKELQRISQEPPDNIQSCCLEMIHGERQKAHARLCTAVLSLFLGTGISSLLDFFLTWSAALFLAISAVLAWCLAGFRQRARLAGVALSAARPGRLSYAHTCVRACTSKIKTCARTAVGTRMHIHTQTHSRRSIPTHGPSSLRPSQGDSKM